MKVRNTHNASVRGIPPKGIGDATSAEIRRYPWALVPLEVPEPAQESAPAPETSKRGKITG